MLQTTHWLMVAIGLVTVAAALVIGALTDARWMLRTGGGTSMRSTLQIGPYALLEKIAAGGTGEVYRARHTGSGHLRAVKLLSRSASERERVQFDKEARLGALLDHPNTVAVHDHGQASDGTRYLAMDLLRGINLEQLIKRDGPQPPGRVISILLQVTAALAALHDQGLVHRDIKPSNILICRGEFGDVVKLVDFGLLERVSERSPPRDSHELVVGTPLYIAPEAISAPGAVDGRSDLYGLGGVAHYLLSGTPVFGGRSLIEICSHQLFTPPEPLSELVGWSIGRDLEGIVLDCLAKDPAARPSNARELGRRLAHCADAEAGHQSTASASIASRFFVAGCPAARCLGESRR